MSKLVTEMEKKKKKRKCQNYFYMRLGRLSVISTPIPLLPHRDFLVQFLLLFFYNMRDIAVILL